MLAPLTAVRCVSPAVRKSSTRPGGIRDVSPTTSPGQQAALVGRQPGARAAEPGAQRTGSALHRRRPAAQHRRAAHRHHRRDRLAGPAGPSRPVRASRCPGSSAAQRRSRASTSTGARVRTSRPRASTRSSRTGTTSRSPSRRSPRVPPRVQHRVGGHDPGGGCGGAVLGEPGQPAAAHGLEPEGTDRRPCNQAQQDQHDRPGHRAPTGPARHDRRHRQRQADPEHDEPADRASGGGAGADERAHPGRDGRSGQPGVERLGRPGWDVGLVGRPGSHGHDRTEVGQRRLTDPRHLTELVDRAEPAVCGAPVEDALRQHRTYPRQRVEGSSVAEFRSTGADGAGVAPALPPPRQGPGRGVGALPRRCTTAARRRRAAGPGSRWRVAPTRWCHPRPAPRRPPGASGEADQPWSVHGADHVHDHLGRCREPGSGRGARSGAPGAAAVAASDGAVAATRRTGGAARAAGWARHSSSAATIAATRRTSPRPAVACRLGTQRTRGGRAPDPGGANRADAGRPGTQPPRAPQSGSSPGGAGASRGDGDAAGGRAGASSPSRASRASPGVRAAASGRRCRESRGLTPRR